MFDHQMITKSEQNQGTYSVITFWYTLKQWIVLNTRADWLLKLPVPFAIHLQAIHVEFAPETVVIFADCCNLFVLCYLTD